MRGYGGRSQSNQSQKFDIGVCQLSRPRPAGGAPPPHTGGLAAWLRNWARLVRLRRAGQGLPCTRLVVHKGEGLGSARARLSIGQGDCLSATA